MNNKVLVCALVSLFHLWAVNVFLWGSDNLNFKHITQEHGLSQSSVYCMVEDNKGFMWFGTQDGLNKYDGYHFTVYRSDPRDETTISGNFIGTLYKDRGGVLWIGTMGTGLNRFDPQTGRFYRYRYSPTEKNGLCSDAIMAIYQDRSGIYWIGTTHGLNRFDFQKGTFSCYQTRAADSSSISGNHVRSIIEDAAGKLWIGTASGLNRFDREKGKFTRYKFLPSEHSNLSDTSITVLQIDHAGYFWVGTNDGLLLFEPETGKFTRYLSRPNDQETLCNNYIKDIFEDRFNVLWIGTVAGLNKFDRRKERFTRYQYDPNNAASLSNNLVQTVYENRSGTLWVGSAGGGVDRFDRTGERFTTYRADPNTSGSLTKKSILSLAEGKDNITWIGYTDGGMDRLERSNNTVKTTYFQNIPGNSRTMGAGPVNSIIEDSQGVLWVGTEKSGLDRMELKTGTFTHYRNNPKDPSSLSNDVIGAIVEEDFDTLWVGTHGGGLNRMSRETGKFTRYLHNEDDPTTLSDNTVFVVRKSRAKFLWIGTESGGLNKFDPRTHRFTSYHTKPDSKHPSSDTILSLYEDPGGILWVGTFAGGLNRFDPKNESFTYVMEKDGLPNNVIYGILEDDRGCLWLSTNNGLAQYDPRTGRCKNYSFKDGLQGNEFNSWAYYKSSRGELFFGGINGLTAFFPRNLEDNPYIPPIVLTDFSISNQPVQPGARSVLSKPISQTQQITLSYKQNVFSFEFVALDYTIPEKNQYAYMMEGFDHEWNYTSAQKRFAAYTNLDPGEYMFRVKGSNNDGVWNQEGVSVKIIITPPLTRTWWFRVLVALFILGASVFFYRRRIGELSQQTRLKTEMQTARDAQMSIMPQSDPVLRGFEVSGLCVPANEVGGDFFDYLWLNEEKTRFCIAIGDVSGKAMKAAMTAIMSSGILFSKVDETDSVREIMTRTNRPLYFKTDKRMFTALCLAALDIQTNLLTFTNAGLSHPMLKSGNTVTLIRDNPPQIPLGVKKDSVYREKEVQLKGGDVLLLFTDGIPETQNSSGQFYEYKSIKHLLETMDTQSLSAVEIKQRIIDDARFFAGNAPQNDDMTIVVIKVLTDR